MTLNLTIDFNVTCIDNLGKPINCTITKEEPWLTTIELIVINYHAKLSDYSRAAAVTGALCNLMVFTGSQSLVKSHFVK